MDVPVTNQQDLFQIVVELDAPGRLGIIAKKIGIFPSSFKR